MSYDYSENILVQESAGNLLRDELGWDVKFAYNTEVLGDNGTFGRKSYKEILLVRYFRAALKNLLLFVGRFFVRQNRRQNKLNRCPQRRAARPADFAVDKRNLKW